MLTLKVTGQTAAWSGCQMTVSGSEGIYELHVDFEDVGDLPSWSELDTFAVFKNSAVPEYPNGVLAQITDGVAEIPACILMNPGLLYVGVYGQLDGKAMPTVWASAVTVVAGCAEGSEAGAEVLSQAENAIKYGENAKVYAEGGYLVISVQTTIGDPVITREGTYTKGAKEYAQDVAGEVAIAEAAALKSEGFAVGEQDGTPVEAGSPYYENNAKFYKEDAAGSASDASDSAAAAGASEAASDASALKAEGFAVGEQDGDPVASGSPYYHNNAEYYNEQASSSASAAAASESASDAFALEAEGFAVGEQKGVPVTEGSPYYENNAKFYSQQRAELAEVAVGVNPIGEASGDLVTVNDAAAAPVRALTAQIVPVQDLHGQSYPYPAGGGKNKLPMTLANIKALNTAGTWSDNDYSYSGITFTVITDDGGNVERIDAKGTATAFVGLQLCGSTSFGAQEVTLNGCPTGGSSTRYDIAVFDDSVSPVANKGNNYGGNGVAFTAESGHTYYARIAIRNTYAISGTISFYPMIRPSDTDATFAPYSNFCPITGWTRATIPHVGADLVEGRILSGTINTSGVVQNNSSGNILRYAPVVQGKKYYIGYDGSNCVIGFFTNVPVAGSTTYNNSRTSTSDAVITAPITGYLAFRRLSTSTYTKCYEGDVATLDWSAYGTVYGGTIEAVTGQGSDTHMRIDLSALTWTHTQGASGWYMRSDVVPNLFNPGSTVAFDGAAEKYKPVPASGFTAQTIAAIAISGAGGTAAISVRNPNNTSETPSGYAVVPVAAPTPFSVTPTPISTLKGDNNVWADCGAVDLEYLKAIDLPLPMVIPPSPAGDGSYHLAVTVAGGVPAFSWEADA